MPKTDEPKFKPSLEMTVEQYVEGFEGLRVLGIPREDNVSCDVCYLGWMKADDATQLDSLWAAATHWIETPDGRSCFVCSADCAHIANRTYLRTQDTSGWEREGDVIDVEWDENAEIEVVWRPGQIVEIKQTFEAHVPPAIEIPVQHESAITQ